MTEITARAQDIAPALQRFIVHWGEMGDLWGVNRSVSQIHALLFISERPLSAEEIAETLNLARSNVSNSVKELVSWGLVRRVQMLGDRRDYYEAESDMLEMVTLIARGRKARELDPAIAALRACAAQAARDSRIPTVARARLNAMLEFVEEADKSFTEIMSLPRPVLSRLIRMGGAIARLLGKPGKAAPKAR